MSNVRAEGYSQVLAGDTSGRLRHCATRRESGALFLFCLPMRRTPTGILVGKTAQVLNRSLAMTLRSHSWQEQRVTSNLVR